MCNTRTTLAFHRRSRLCHMRTVHTTSNTTLISRGEKKLARKCLVLLYECDADEQEELNI